MESFLTLPPNSQWTVGQDDNIYWWPSFSPDTPNSKTRNVNTMRNETIDTLPLTLKEGVHVLAVDKNSRFYLAQTINIGKWISNYTKTGECLWTWCPPTPLHAFAHTIDSTGKLYYVPSDGANKNIYGYHPQIGLEAYNLPVFDTIYGIAVNGSEIYSIQLPLGHFVVHSNPQGETQKILGDLKNFGKSEEKSLWPVFYPEGIQLDEAGNLWITEMGRQCLTVLDRDLNILQRFYQTDLEIETKEGQALKFKHFGVGNRTLWLEHATEQKTQLYSYLID